MTDLEVYQPNGAALSVPGQHDTDSWITVCSDVIKVANVIYDTPFVPDGLRGSAPAVAAAILAGRELGIGPMTALQHIHVIKGKPAQSAALMRALIQAAGHQWQDGDVTDTRAVVRGRRKGESEWAEVVFTADQARKAGIDLGKYPQDKLYARATSRLARRKFADVIAGMPYSAEELEDGDGDGPVTEPHTPADKAAQRTARRRQAAPKDTSPAGRQARAEDPPSPPADTAAATPAGEAPLPPLPGEDEPDEKDSDSPGTVTRAQLTKLGATFTGLGFTSAEREQRLVTASEVVGRDLKSSAELSKNEAATLIDTLERCEGSRERLIALLAQGDAPEEDGDDRA
jgi:hypothetical protein